MGNEKYPTPRPGTGRVYKKGHKLRGETDVINVGKTQHKVQHIPLTKEMARGSKKRINTMTRQKERPERKNAVKPVKQWTYCQKLLQRKCRGPQRTGYGVRRYKTTVKSKRPSIS